MEPAKRFLGWLLCFAAASGCGGGGELVDPAAIAACGHFTAEAAAAILEVPAAELETKIEEMGPNLRLCVYRHASRGTPGLSFYLSIKESVEEAADDMAQGRSMAGFAQETIDTVTGTESEEEALSELQNLGDEAYFMAVNGTLNVRVRNVQIQVTSMQDKGQMIEVAREVASGLAP